MVDIFELVYCFQPYSLSPCIKSDGNFYFLFCPRHQNDALCLLVIPFLSYSCNSFFGS